MTGSGIPDKQMSAETTDATDYRPISGLAMAGCLLGLLSLLAFSHPFFWWLPVAAISANGMALRRIAVSSPKPIGRRAALVGLSIALICGTAAPTRVAIVRWQVEREARRLTRQWVDFLRQGEPYKADQLSESAVMRLPLDESLPARYAGQTSLQRRLAELIEQPAVRALLAAGPSSRVHYYRSDVVRSTSTEQELSLVYAISFRDQGKLRSFFVQVIAIRALNRATDAWDWHIYSSRFLRKPPDE